jgi:hypothetical protein
MYPIHLSKKLIFLRVFMRKLKHLLCCTCWLQDGTHFKRFKSTSRAVIQQRQFVNVTFMNKITFRIRPPQFCDKTSEGEEIRNTI